MSDYTLQAKLRRDLMRKVVPEFEKAVGDLSEFNYQFSKFRPPGRNGEGAHQQIDREIIRALEHLSNALAHMSIAGYC